MPEREPITSFPKSKINVLLLENVHPNAREVFESEGYPVESLPYSPPEKELQERMQDTYILGIRSRTHLSQDVFDGSPKLLAVGAFCIGTEQIDLPASTHSGVAVFNAPFSNTRSVAELAMGQMINLARGITEKNEQMKRGIFDKSAQGYELRGKTLGIIGYGNIGKQLSVLAESFGLNVVFYNTSETLSMGNARKASSMDEVLSEADIVSIHVSGKPSNANLIGHRNLKPCGIMQFFLTWPEDLLLTKMHLQNMQKMVN